MTRKPGPPQIHRVSDGGVFWLASLPRLGTYRVEQLLEGGCELFRLLPVVARPRGAVPVPLTGSRPEHR